MAIIRRSRNPWMRARTALRATQGTMFVLRHGSTDRNLGGVGEDMIRGHDDIPMTIGGEREVEVTARIIAPCAIREIYSSDLRRAVCSAEIVSDANIAYPDIDRNAALRSWDMGPSMEGMVTTPDVVAKIRGWVDADETVPPGGESFRAFAERLLCLCRAAFRGNAGTWGYVRDRRPRAMLPGNRFLGCRRLRRSLYASGIFGIFGGGAGHRSAGRGVAVQT